VPVETDARLLEIAHGTWEGRYRDEIAASEPDLYRTWREHPERVRFDGGESLTDVLTRWTSFASQFDARANAVLFTHDIVVRIALLERAGRPMDELRTVRALNAAYAWFDVDDGVWTLRQECVSGHLAGLTADPEKQAL
jgi:probable phosphoglycerate mutase